MRLRWIHRAPPQIRDLQVEPSPHVDDGTQRFPAPHKIQGRELTLKHGELKMIPKPAHQIEHLPQPLIIRNVITD
jgi:hypothetical protein